MNHPTPVSLAEMVATPLRLRPHLVLLGAGASRAACLNGDRNGRRLPVMADFTEVLPIRHLVPESARGINFELYYSRLVAEPEAAEQCREIERIVYEYFESLELPDEPTIYDYLVLSLRSKDVIATFNWDPFLLQALRRNGQAIGSYAPSLLFLHGNVLEGFCREDKVFGTKGTRCSKCGRPFPGTPLLYPVAKKDYSSDEALRETWARVAGALRQAFAVTVFGYGAPATDVEAVDLLRNAWGTPEAREFEEFEFIDVRPEDEVRASWNSFVHSHHYTVTSSYFSSALAMHPRRTVEDLYWRLIEARFTTTNDVPQGVSLRELQSWMRSLQEAELAGEKVPPMLEQLQQQRKPTSDRSTKSIHKPAPSPQISKSTDRSREQKARKTRRKTRKAKQK